MGRVGGVVVLCLALSFFLVACPGPAAPVKSMNVTARLEMVTLESGGSTVLVVDATNNGTLPVSGSFEIVPENDQVSVETCTETFSLRPQETTGQKRYTLTAYANSVRQDIQITVRFKDADGTVGSTSVILNVHK